MARVNIVCSDFGWCYDQFVAAFKKYSTHTILRNSKERCDVVYYLPYYEYKKTDVPCAAWFSHMEDRKDLKNKFLFVAQQVNVAISQSRKYAKVISDLGVKNVVQVMPGVDLDKFVMRKPKNRDNAKMIVGHVGRAYQSSARKNPSLIKKISKLPYVDFRCTNGKLSMDQLPAFYADLDILVSPSKIEGGPMCLVEAAAVGVPSIAFKEVGIADEFDFGMFKVDGMNDDAFLAELEQIWLQKRHRDWYYIDTMQKTRDQVLDKTWNNFVLEHDKVFTELSKE